MTVIYAYLGVLMVIWVRRAILTLSSINKYSLIPSLSWDKQDKPEKVSLLIPCRNEARNLDILMPSLMAQDYPNLEIVFLNDRSTDNTFDILKSYSEKDSRIRILQGKDLPSGWTGKNHALQQLAEASTGRWLLFTDADTEHERHSVSSSIHYASERKLDLLTLSARCVCKSFGEHLIQPMGIGCFSIWSRLESVNDPDSQTPLACGQYFLIKRDVFFKVGGNEAVKHEVTEDLALFQKVKNLRYRSELGIGAHLFATRMYQSFSEAWVGWRRIYLHALQKNVPSLLSKIFMLVVNSFGPFLLFAISLGLWLSGRSDWLVATLLSAAVCVFILFLRSRAHLALKVSQWSILLHPLSALVICGIITDCLRHHFEGRKVEWKMEKY